MKKNLVLVIIVLISVAVVIGAVILINISEKNRSSNKGNSTSKVTDTIVDNFVPGRVEIKVTEISEDSIKGIVVNGGIIFKELLWEIICYQQKRHSLFMIVITWPQELFI